MTTTTQTPDLVADSVRVILDGQAASGAYVASPNFSQYRFGWLRDGAFVALAMDAADRHDSARAFHEWVRRVLETQSGRIERVLEAVTAGREPAPEDRLPTRYTLDGAEEPEADEAWPNFQLDGYGTWLFALNAHLNGALPPEFEPSVRSAARYIAATWRLPCYDYWEEFGDRVHTSTLAALAAGLRSAAELLAENEWLDAADDIVAFIRSECVADGSFVKGPEDARVDASLVSLATPFGVIPSTDPVMAATIERIRTELSSPSGGIRRYLGDSYFGGNPWLLLTAWLGWHDRLTGNAAGAQRAREWVLAHRSEGNNLAEQILDEPQVPEAVAEWTERWGPVADPLLWSHAKLILLERGGVRTWS
ncbi:MAG: glycoside hydrolase family 15 protein [Actinobacteria bacterium]|nr:glycoside hydrolase family 15 protein [Actinomycetota bacterium]